MHYLYDGSKYLLVFQDGIRFEIDKDLWERLKKLKESDSL